MTIIKPATAPKVEQPATVPLGATCHRHPSALAHWRASLLTYSTEPLERFMCDHCHTIEGTDLEDAGWFFSGAPVVCNCLACMIMRGERPTDDH